MKLARGPTVWAQMRRRVLIAEHVCSNPVAGLGDKSAALPTLRPVATELRSNSSCCATSAHNGGFQITRSRRWTPQALLKLLCGHRPLRYHPPPLRPQRPVATAHQRAACPAAAAAAWLMDKALLPVQTAQLTLSGAQARKRQPRASTGTPLA